jgi:hypothetical protein
MSKRLWGSVLIVSVVLLLVGVANDAARPGVLAGWIGALREVSVPWECLLTELPVALVAGCAVLLVMGLAGWARGAGGRRRVAERMLRSGLATVAVARRTGLARDAVRMLAS